MYALWSMDQPMAVFRGAFASREEAVAAAQELIKVGSVESYLISELDVPVVPSEDWVPFNG